jgi:hypothetical protein
VVEVVVLQIQMRQQVAQAAQVVVVMVLEV